MVREAPEARATDDNALCDREVRDRERSIWLGTVRCWPAVARGRQAGECIFRIELAQRACSDLPSFLVLFLFFLVLIFQLIVLEFIQVIIVEADE